VCNQVEYHPYLDQTRVREACADGMAVVAYSPIAKGRVRNDEMLAGSARRMARALRRFAALAGAAGRSAPIPRTSRLERLSENMEIFDFELSEAEMGQISGIGSRTAG